jgi:Extracellular link domain
MYESYTDSATKYADKQEQENTNKKTVKDSSGNSTHAKTTTTTTVTTSTSSGEPGATWEDLFNSLFNKSTLFYLILFLGIYIVLYFSLGVFFNKGGDASSFQVKLSRTLDMIFFGFIILLIVSYLYSGNVGSINSAMLNGFSSLGDFISKPSAIITTSLFLLAFYIIVYLFRIPMTSDIKPFFISIIESLAWLMFIIVGIVDFFKYVLGIPIEKMFSALWNNLPDDKPVRDSSNNVVRDSSHNKVKDSSNNIVAHDEVFNISNNLYTYDDAQAICAAYGAKLANYDQMEDAYNKGAEWCNYGWSDGQMIFFPTQKSTWQELQKDPAKKNNCGRPGVNGGFIQNPYVKFGVNCFGKKPQPSADDLARVNAADIPATTPEDAALNAKIKYWKDNAASLLKINSFNKKEWSEY